MHFGLPPASVILTWPVADYQHPVTRNPGILATGSIFFGLATIAVFLRLYARLYIRRWFGLDDLLICVGWLAAVGVQATVYLGVYRYGWNRHLWELEPLMFRGSLKLLYASALSWAVASSCIRFSLLCFYYRLSTHVRLRHYVWVLHVMMAISVAFFFGYFFSLVFICVPVNALWDKVFVWDQAQCIDIGSVMISGSIINTVLELIVTLLPLPFIIGLNMSLRQKFSVFGILNLGIFISIVGCVRCWFVWKALVSTWDVSWWGVPHWVVSEVENNLALICACIPALRPVLGRLFTRKPICPSLHNSGKDSLESSKQVKLLKSKRMMDPPSRNRPGYIDLEGIADDGYGYTVKIYAGTSDESFEQTHIRSNSTLLTGDWRDSYQTEKGLVEDAPRRYNGSNEYRLSINLPLHRPISRNLEGNGRPVFLDNSTLDTSSIAPSSVTRNEYDHVAEPARTRQYRPNSGNRRTRTHPTNTSNSFLWDA